MYCASQGYTQKGIRFVLPQEHQSFLSKVEESKDSEFSFIMGVYENFFYYFETYLKNKQIVFQNNFVEKYRFSKCIKTCIVMWVIIQFL